MKKTFRKFILLCLSFMSIVLASCSKEETPELSLCDLTGTWQSEYFEQPPLYGPLTVEVRGNYTMKVKYVVEIDPGSPFGVTESCMFSLEGNRIHCHSVVGYSATVTVTQFTGKTAIFTIESDGISLTQELSKIE